MTIHSFIHRHMEHNKKTDESDIIKYQQPHTIIVDEMSMVSLYLFYDLICVLNRYERIRLVLVGDPDQLPSINGGTIFSDLIYYSGIPRTCLEHNHRTNNESIIDNAKLVIEGRDIKPEKITQNFSFTWIETNTKENIGNTLMKLLEKFKIKPNNSCILIPQNKKGEISTLAFNKKLQEYYNKDGTPLCKNKHYDLRMGDKLINKKNNTEKKIYNGSILTCQQEK